MGVKQEDIGNYIDDLPVAEREAIFSAGTHPYTIIADPYTLISTAYATGKANAIQLNGFDLVPLARTVFGAGIVFGVSKAVNKETISEAKDSGAASLGMINSNGPKINQRLLSDLERHGKKTAGDDSGHFSDDHFENASIVKKKDRQFINSYALQDPPGGTGANYFVISVSGMAGSKPIENIME